MGVEQRAAGFRSCGGGEQQTGSRAHHGRGIGAQFGASATLGAAASARGAVRGDIAEVELAVCGGAGQERAQLAGVIVDAPLVVAIAAEALRMPAGQGLPRCIGRGPGQGVLRVVQLHGDHRTVDVAVDERHQHLRAGARQVIARREQRANEPAAAYRR